MSTQRISSKAKLGKPTRDKLFDLYWRQGLHEAQIADLYQVEPDTVISWIIKDHIPLRDYYESVQLNYFKAGGVAASTQSTLQYKIPYDCLITSVVTHFPEGCSGLVQVSLRLADGTVIFPYKGDYIALDGATERFEFVYFLASGTDLRCVIANTDSANPHNPEVIVTIRKLAVQEVG